MFSKQEAVQLVQSCWGVQRVEERLATHRTALLDDIVTSIQSHVPFQTVTLLALPLSERKRPSLEAIKEEGLSGVGGLCYTVNVFTWGLLNGLGFSAHLCPATVTFLTVTRPDSHIFVLIKDLEKKGDLHLIDCASGYPTFRAVSLNFEQESPVFTESFLEYKYIRHDGQFLRMHGDGDRVMRDTPQSAGTGLNFCQGKWRRFYFFTVRTIDDVNEIAAIFDYIYTNTSFLHTSLWAVSYPNRRTVFLSNGRLRLENDDHKLETTVLEGDEQILQASRRYFPNLQEETFRRAIDEWRRVKPTA